MPCHDCMIYQLGAITQFTHTSTSFYTCHFSDSRLEIGRRGKEEAITQMKWNQTNSRLNLSEEKCHKIGTNVLRIFILIQTNSRQYEWTIKNGNRCVWRRRLPSPFHCVVIKMQKITVAINVLFYELSFDSFANGLCKRKRDSGLRCLCEVNWDVKCSLTTEQHHEYSCCKTVEFAPFGIRKMWF